jgi:hypothetical protein
MVTSAETARRGEPERNELETTKGPFGPCQVRGNPKTDSIGQNFTLKQLLITHIATSEIICFILKKSFLIKHDGYLYLSDIEQKFPK